MKFIALTIGLLLPFFSWSEDRKYISVKRPWYAAISANHIATTGKACFAYTSSRHRRYRLEVMAEGFEKKGFALPTVLLLADGHFKFHSAQLLFDRQEFPLNMAQYPAPPSYQTAVVDQVHRQEVIGLLRSSHFVSVRLKNHLTGEEKQVAFALRNSLRVIDAMLKSCH